MIKKYFWKIQWWIMRKIFARKKLRLIKSLKKSKLKLQTAMMEAYKKASKERKIPLHKIMKGIINLQFAVRNFDIAIYALENPPKDTEGGVMVVMPHK